MMPSLKASMRESSNPLVGFPERKGRGLRGKEPTNGRRWCRGILGCRRSWSVIMLSATRTKRPEPMEMEAARQRDIRRAVEVGGRVAETV